MEEKLFDCVQYSLQNFLYQNAIFYAERLHAHLCTEQTLQTLATVYSRAGKPNQAYTILKHNLFNGLFKSSSSKTSNEISEESKYLFATCCYQIGKYKEAETILLSKDPNVKDPLTKVPNGAAGLFVLGQVSAKLQLKKRAVDCYKKCLELNPFLWTAYEALCKLGENVDPGLIYGNAELELLNMDLNNMSTQSSITNTNTILNSQHSHSIIDDSMESPAVWKLPRTPHMARTPGPITATPFLAVPATPSNPPTPIGISTKLTTEALATPYTPHSNNNPEVFQIPQTSTAPSNAVPVFMNAPKQNRKRVEETPKRKVLFQTPESIGAPLNKRHHSQEPNSVVHAPRHSMSKALSFAEKSAEKKPIKQMNTRRRASTIPATNPGKQNTVSSEATPNETVPVFTPISSHHNTTMELDESTIQTTEQYRSILVLSLLKLIADGYRNVYDFKCREAISAFQKLPPQHYNTARILTHVARAYYELVDYPEARKLYEEARRIEPYFTEGVEIYSTILWHMRKEVELSYLAHELVELDNRQAESWCVVGNCFSLQKEHEAAIKFFQRALYLEPSLAYAHTLCGHEYVSSDDLDKALVCFRNAIAIDDRHYNAWYGVGMIYQRQEKFDMAEYHFRKAIQINNQSSVLYCYLGMVLHSNNKLEESLHALDTALKIDPSNSLAKFKRASVLASLQQYQKAMSELQALKELAPREAPIFFLMGKVARKLNQDELALQYLTTAMDLDSKNANYIKSIIDKLHIQAENEDEEFELL